MSDQPSLNRSLWIGTLLRHHSVYSTGPSLLTFTSSKSTTETLEKGAKYVQS